MVFVAGRDGNKKKKYNTSRTLYENISYVNLIGVFRGGLVKSKG